MKNKLQYVVKPFPQVPVLVLLAVLTLFSSCTVRKSIQAHLDVPVNRQLNPSKTTLTGQNQCQYESQQLASEQVDKTGFEIPTDFLTGIYSTCFFSPGIEIQPLSCASANWCVSQKVPIYILYKKMKLWL